MSPHNIELVVADSASSDRTKLASEEAMGITPDKQKNSAYSPV